MSPLTKGSYLANYAVAQRVEPKVLVSITTIRDEDDVILWGANFTWEHVNSSTSGPWAKQFGRVKFDDADIEADYEIQISLCFGSLLQSP